MPTKTRRLRQYAREADGVYFVAKTPESRKGTPTQAVLLKNFKVSKAKNGHYILSGKSVARELESQSIGAYRNYRVDRIVNGTITPFRQRKHV